MRQHEKVIEFFSIALLTLVGLLGMFVAVLDFIGTDFVSGPWRWLKGTQPIILLTVATLTLALGLERYARFQQIHRQLDDITDLVAKGPERVIRSLGGVDTQQFSDTQQFYEYTIRRMREAKEKIDDTTWGVTPQQEETRAAQNAFKKYKETLYQVCKEEKMSYREIMSFPPLGNVERAEEMFRKIRRNPKESAHGYQLRYYELPEEKGPPPLITFMVIDSEEVIIASYRSSILPTGGAIRLAVRHPRIVKLFQDYYDAVWAEAQVLKESGRGGDFIKLQEIKSRLERQQSRTGAQV